MTSKKSMNPRIVLAQRPQPSATLASFRLEQAPIPDLAQGEVLLRTLWLSLDPYMRGRMSEHAPQAFLGILEGANFGKLVVSLDDALRVTA